jgi:hypothetical protein
MHHSRKSFRDGTIPRGSARLRGSAEKAAGALGIDVAAGGVTRVVESIELPAQSKKSVRRENTRTLTGQRV